ncbi:IS3 family transposase [Marinicrinis sediminis]|uniref:IS3 family transposase n=1 Tax=Marinicrinis sediminis TaxID=1652465 RepID=A0ABW5REY2_9BACL
MLCRTVSLSLVPSSSFILFHVRVFFDCIFIVALHFQNLHHLELELCGYVNWFNKYRIHGTLGYMTPVQYRQAALKKIV